MKKQYLIFLLSIFGVSQVNAGIVKCFNIEHRVFYRQLEEPEIRKMIKESCSFVCEAVGYSSYSKLEKIEWQKLEDESKKISAECQSNDKELLEAAKIEVDNMDSRIRLNQRLAEDRYSEKVKETAKFLDDVEAARKRK